MDVSLPRKYSKYCNKDLKLPIRSKSYPWRNNIAGTANINLDQDPTQGIADAVFSPDRVDDILLDRLLAKCAEHLSLLAAPSTLERTYDFEPGAFNQVLEVVQRGVPTLVVDVPNQWNHHHGHGCIPFSRGAQV